MARDLFHDAVKNALIKDGWLITDDPFFLKVGDSELYIDLGAERLIAAERNNEFPRMVIQECQLDILVYDVKNEVIVQWKI